MSGLNETELDERERSKNEMEKNRVQFEKLNDCLHSGLNPDDCHKNYELETGKNIGGPGSISIAQEYVKNNKKNALELELEQQKSEAAARNAGVFGGKRYKRKSLKRRKSSRRLRRKSSRRSRR